MILNGTLFVNTSVFHQDVERLTRHESVVIQVRPCLEKVMFAGEGSPRGEAPERLLERRHQWTAEARTSSP